MKRRKRTAARVNRPQAQPPQCLFFDLQPLDEHDDARRRRYVVVQNIRPAPRINGRN